MEAGHWAGWKPTPPSGEVQCQPPFGQLSPSPPVGRGDARSWRPGSTSGLERARDTSQKRTTFSPFLHQGFFCLPTQSQPPADEEGAVWRSLPPLGPSRHKHPGCRYHGGPPPCDVNCAAPFLCFSFCCWPSRPPQALEVGAEEDKAAEGNPPGHGAKPFHSGSGNFTNSGLRDIFFFEVGGDGLRPFLARNPRERQPKGPPLRHRPPSAISTAGE